MYIYMHSSVLWRCTMQDVSTSKYFDEEMLLEIARQEAAMKMEDDMDDDEY
jgi:hypothetical protein